MAVPKSGGGWWVKATAFPSRSLQDGRPGCPLTHQPSIASHCGGRSPIGRAPARRMSTKNPRAGPRDTAEDRRGREFGRPGPDMPNRHPPCPACWETPRSQPPGTNGLAPSQPHSRRARLPIRVASYHPTQSANRFQENFLDNGDFAIFCKAVVRGRVLASRRPPMPPDGGRLRPTVAGWDPPWHRSLRGSGRRGGLSPRADRRPPHRPSRNPRHGGSHSRWSG